MNDCSKLKEIVEEIRSFTGGKHGEIKIKELLDEENGKEELVSSFLRGGSFHYGVMLVHWKKCIS